MLAQAATIFRRHREVVDWTEETLRWHRELVDNGPDSVSWGLYNSACCAARLAFEDDVDLPSEERDRLRGLAHDWLRVEVEHWIPWMANEDPSTAVARRRLSHSLTDADFAPLRGSALESLGAAEREAWSNLWAEVEAALSEGER